MFPDGHIDLLYTTIVSWNILIRRHIIYVDLVAALLATFIEFANLGIYTYRIIPVDHRTPPDYVPHPRHSGPPIAATGCVDRLRTALCMYRIDMFTSK